MAVRAALVITLLATGMAKLLGGSARGPVLILSVGCLEVAVACLLMSRFVLVAAYLGLVLAAGFVAATLFGAAEPDCGCLGHLVQLERGQRLVLAGGIGAASGILIALLGADARPDVSKGLSVLSVADTYNTNGGAG